MLAKLQSWWQKTSKTLDAVVILMLVVLTALVVVIILGYTNNWNWTGLHGKTLYDWLQLLIIPAVLAVGGYLFTYTTSRNEQKATQQRDQTERDISLDNQREQALQAYIDSMSELLLHEKLRDSDKIDEVRTIARVRTLTVLPRLDEGRKGSVLKFLYESGLIQKDRLIMDLRGADLSKASLTKASLSGACLSGADLHEADLSYAYLSKADLSEANLSEANLFLAYLSGAELIGTKLFEAKLRIADLSEADLRGADLSIAYLTEANLRGAKVTTEQLSQARSLKGTTMPDGTKHD